MTDDEELMARHIVQDPDWPDPARAYIRHHGVSVWALVAYYQGAAEGSTEQVAEDYELPAEAVQAALAFYGRHSAAIDAWIAANA